MMNLRNLTAFTLIEVLISVALSGLLIVLLNNQITGSLKTDQNIKSKMEYKIEIEKHLEIQKMLYGFIILTILIGFVLYYRKQYKEYYKTWSTISFLFGVNKCKSLA